MVTNVESDMLVLLLKKLPSDFEEICKAKDKGDLAQLQKHVHKLHGALCYCGVPSLKDATANLEKALLNNEIKNIDSLFNLFKFEVLNILKKQ